MRREGGHVEAAQWYGFVYKKNLREFDERKAVVQVIARDSRFAIDSQALYFTGGGNGPYYGLRPREDSGLQLSFLVGLLNSRLLEFYLRQVSSPFRGGYWSYGKRFIELLPIVQPVENEDMEAIVQLSSSLAECARQVQSALTPHEASGAQRTFSVQRAALDRRVFDLYGLTNAEIGVAEATLQKE